jgi:hypothetical protein
MVYTDEIQNCKFSPAWFRHFCLPIYKHLHYQVTDTTLLLVLSPELCHDDVWASEYSSTLLSHVTKSSWVAISRPGRFIPGTHFIGIWVGPRARGNAMVKRTILLLSRIKPWLLGRPARRLFVVQLSHYGSYIIIIIIIIIICINLFSSSI